MKIPKGLSERQGEVYELVAEGLPYSAIAVILKIETRTVEDHALRIKRQLNLEGPPGKAIMIHARPLRG